MVSGVCRAEQPMGAAGAPALPTRCLLTSCLERWPGSETPTWYRTETPPATATPRREPHAWVPPGSGQDGQCPTVLGVGGTEGLGAAGSQPADPSSVSPDPLPAAAAHHPESQWDKLQVFLLFIAQK